MDSVSGREDLQRNYRELTRKGIAAELAKTTEGFHLVTSCVQDHRGWLVERQGWLASVWLTPGKSISKHRSSWGSSGDILRSGGQGLWGKTGIVFLPPVLPPPRNTTKTVLSRDSCREMVQPLWKMIWQFFKKKKLSCVINYHMIQKFCFWMYNPKECIPRSQRDICICMFTAAVFTTAKWGKPPKCP